MFRVARIGKPHGIRGEVTVEVFTDSPETRFTPGNVLTVHSEGKTHPNFETLTVEKSRWNNKILLLKFTEFSDRNTAESFRNFMLYAPAEDSLDESDGWYADDLIGMKVYLNDSDSERIGEVSDLITGAAQDLLEIRLADGQTVLLPFVDEIVPHIDEELRTIVITPPAGLLELNQE